jgi:hypothetical protein
MVTGTCGVEMSSLSTGTTRSHSRLCRLAFENQPAKIVRGQPAHGGICEVTAAT